MIYLTIYIQIVITYLAVIDNSKRVILWLWTCEFYIKVKDHNLWKNYWKYLTETRRIPSNMACNKLIHKTTILKRKIVSL